MLTKDEKKKLKSMLPHGAQKKIAMMAGVSVQSVNGFFAGRAISSERIEIAALDFMNDYQENMEKKKRCLK